MNNNKEEEDEDEGIVQGDCIYKTSDTKLAVAMATVGFKPFKYEPIVKRVNKDGTEDLVFNLNCRSKDDQYEARQCEDAWKKGTEYIENNPDDHFAIAMCALKNHSDMLELIKRRKRIFEYDIGSMVVYVTEGTKKQQILEKKYGPKRKKQPSIVEYPEDNKNED